MDEDNKATLEAMVDRFGLEGVLNALGDVCGEKAEHVRSAWNDEATAKAWDRAARLLGDTAAKPAVKFLSA